MNSPLEFQELQIVRYELENDNWLEIEYHKNNVYLVDSSLFSEEIVCHGEDELLATLGF